MGAEQSRGGRPSSSRGQSSSRNRLGYSSRSKRGAQQASGSGIRRLPVAIALVAVLGIAYFASAGMAGKWLADRLIAPIMGWTDKAPKNPPTGFLAAPNDATPTPAVSAAPTAAPERVALGLNSYACYALQMGAFEGSLNAEAEAGGVKQSGGAGYIWRDGMYRVLAAGYLSLADAEKVRDQLKQVGTDATVYTYQAPAVTLNVTANRTQVDCLKQSFTAIEDTIAQLETVSMDLDMGNINANTAKQRLGELHQKMLEVVQQMNQQFVGSENVPTIAAMMSMGAQAEQLLANGPGEVGQKDLSIWLKTARLDLACRYIQSRKALI